MSGGWRVLITHMTQQDGSEVISDVTDKVEFHEVERDVFGDEITDAIRSERIAAALWRESSEPLGWWYLSFTDPDRPKGTQFLGACVVEARGIAQAIGESHRLGLNPGGEVLPIQVPADKEPVPEVRGRLLSAREARDMELQDVGGTMAENTEGRDAR